MLSSERERSVSGAIVDTALILLRCCVFALSRGMRLYVSLSIEGQSVASLLCVSLIHFSNDLFGPVYTESPRRKPERRS